MEINKEQVLKFLPHRDPFLFVDSIECILLARDFKPADQASLKELVGAEVLANYRTEEDHPIFAGHFPGNPILPGVVQVEMMAQASCFALVKLHPDPFSMKLEVALLAVSNAKFRKPIKPNMDLKIKSTCTKARGSFVNYDCQIFHGEELMSEASVFATVSFTKREE
jgi:3-hydroxyacyl-[acyl-carrier-protein] dehydratase